MPITKLESQDLQGRVSLCIIPSETYTTKVLDIFQLLVKQGLDGIYVTMNRTPDTLVKLLEERGIPTDHTYFVDCVSPMVGLKPEIGARCKGLIICPGGPGKLSDVNMAISEFCKQAEGSPKFLFFDSLATLLIYNDEIAVQKFSHILTTKLRALSLTTVLASIEKEVGTRMIGILSQFVDQVVEI